MSITEAIHHYNVGTLITLTTHRLGVARQVLENKIDYMDDVIKTQPVVPELMADVRKYKAVLEDITRLISDRQLQYHPSEVRFSNKTIKALQK